MSYIDLEYILNDLETLSGKGQSLRQAVWNNNKPSKTKDLLVINPLIICLFDLVSCNKKLKNYLIVIEQPELKSEVYDYIEFLSPKIVAVVTKLLNFPSDNQFLIHLCEQLKVVDDILMQQDNINLQLRDFIVYYKNKSQKYFISSPIEILKVETINEITTDKTPLIIEKSKQSSLNLFKSQPSENGELASDNPFFQKQPIGPGL